MKYLYTNRIIYAGLLIIILFWTQSCDSNIAQKNEVLLDSAKTLFIQFDQMPNKEKINDQALLNESIALLEGILKTEPDNPGANYYYGYALDRKLNDGVDILNFELINPNSTKQISAPFEKIVNNSNFIPDYKLSQYSKISNTWGILALNYMLKGKPDSAEFAFKTGIKLGGYRPVNLEYSRNIMNSLEPNSILFIDTDLETFSFWYLQFVEHIRPDISIINLSLLDYQWYAKWISWSPNFTNTVLTNLNDESLNTLYATMNAPVPDSNITIEYRKSTLFSKYKSNISFVLKGRNRNNDGILFPAIDRVALSIIRSNVWERPIYFSINSSKTLPYSLGLAQHLKLEGLVAKLCIEQIPLELSVNGEKCSKNLMNNYVLAHLQNTESYSDRDIGYFTDLYKFAFLQTMYFYVDYSSDKSSAKTILIKFETVFPEAKFQRNNEELEIIRKIRNL